MKILKVLVACGVVFCLAGFMACGGGKYGDVKKVLEKQVAAMDGYASDMEKAGSAKDVAAAMNKFTEAMKELVPQMKELDAKFPELKNMGKEPPPELKDLMKKFEEISGKLISASMKAAQYMQDPEVQAAQQKFAEVTGGLK